MLLCALVQTVSQGRWLRVIVVREGVVRPVVPLPVRCIRQHVSWWRGRAVCSVLLLPGGTRVGRWRPWGHLMGLWSPTSRAARA